MELPDPIFFLSYARADNADQFVLNFFNQLRESVRSKLGLSSSKKVGFLDLNITLGEKWDEDLFGSLGRVPAFVPLFSPTFFGRETCGREWYVIQQRLVEHRRLHGTEPRAIFPVLWQTIDDAAMRKEFEYALRYQWAFQFERAPAHPPRSAIAGIVPEPVTPEDLQEDRLIYERLGLFGLYRRTRNNAIQNILEQLTEAILATTKPPGPLTTTYRIPQLADTRNEFEPSVEYEEKSAGVGKLHIRVAAEGAPPREMKGPYRRKGGEFWIPYSKVDITGVKLAQDAAGEEGLQTSSDPLDGKFAEFLDDKKMTNELVLVLVDPESLPGNPPEEAKGSRFCDYMRSLDAAWANTIVVIPWDRDAEHPQSHLQQMQAVANRLFANRRARQDELFLHSVEDHVAFKEGLKKCLVKAINMTIARSEFLAPPSTTYAVPVPNPHSGGASGAS